MHRFPTKSAIRRMRFAALLVCLRNLMVAASFSLLLYIIFTQNQKVALYALLLVPATVIVLLLQTIVSAHTSCPLCMTPMLGNKSCNKHSKAKRTLGSYKFTVAIAVLFCHSFRCPYCNEPAILQSHRDQ